jgi:ABC-type dipeptide/oligopeptide/nickel transport system permease subunit
VTHDSEGNRPSAEHDHGPASHQPEVDAIALASQTLPHSGQVSASAQALLDAEVVQLRQGSHRFRGLVRRPKFVVGAVLFGVVVLLAILAPLVARYNPNTPDFSAINQNPSSAHLLGTDYLGRDLWARLVWGGRTSLPAGCLIVLFSFVVGVPWGIMAGYGNRQIEEMLMRLIDVLLAVPGLVLALTIVAILGPSIKSVIIALGVAGIPGYARIARASTLSTKGLDYVLSARAQGAGPLHIMRTHILRSIVDPLVIVATLNLSGAILAAAAFSFLGIGTQLPGADWGTMLASGYNYMFLSWAQVTFPAIIIVTAVLGINLLGDMLGEFLNPRLRSR